MSRPNKFKNAFNFLSSFSATLYARRLFAHLYTEFSFPGVSVTPNISSCACASTTHCRSADYLKLKGKIVTFVSFLTPSVLMSNGAKTLKFYAKQKSHKIYNTSISEFSFSPQADVII